MNPRKCKHIVGSMAAGGLLLVGLLALLVLVAMACQTVQAVDTCDRYVLGIDASDTSDCSDEQHPCRTVQYAIDQAVNGDVVCVAKHTLAGPLVYPETLAITKSVTLDGAWDAMCVDPNNLHCSFTAISCDPGNVTIDAGGIGRVISISGSITPTINCFTITGGDAAGLGGDNWGFDAGGGVYAVGSTPTISDCQVISNTAERGGGLYLHSSLATLVGNRFVSNITDKGGGGLFLYDSNAILDGNSVISNVTTGSDGGGLLLSFSDDATLSGNTFGGNVASAHGGGIYLHNSDATIDGNTFTGNSAGMRGGAAATYSSNPTISANSVISNTAASWGGGMFLYGDSPTLVNNIVADNRAGEYGAGLYFWNSSSRLLHNTIAGNHGGDGSGLCVGHYSTGSSSVVFTNTILVGHTVGITVAEGDSATLEGTLWGSGAWANGDDWGGDGSVATGTINVRGEPDFMSLAEWDYHIGPHSAAIDAALTIEVESDIDGETRPWPAGGAADIGADEARWRSLFLPLVLRGSG